MGNGNGKTSGFTLVELMLALTLLGLVLSGGFTLYYFADRAFVEGTVTADIQADVQLAMRRIVDELRLAYYLELAPAPPPDDFGDDDDDHFIFVNDDGLVVLKTRVGEEVLTSLTRDVSRYRVTFAQAGDGLVKVKLEAVHPNVSYSLESDVEILNLYLEGIKGPSASSGVYYQREMGKIERPDAWFRRACLVTWLVGDDQDQDLDVFRRLRDNVLMKTGVGKRIVDWYYERSGQFIEALEQMPAAVAALKAALWAAAWVLRYPEPSAFIFGFGLVFLVGIVAVRRFRKPQEV